MDKLIKIFGLVGVAFLGLRIIGNRVSNSISISNAQLRNLKINLTALSLDLILTIKNNNQVVPLPADDFQGAIVFQNTSIANVRLPSPVSLPPGAMEVIPIRINVPTPQIPGTIAVLLASGGVGQMKLVGTLTSNGIPARVEKNIIQIG